LQALDSLVLLTPRPSFVWLAWTRGWLSGLLILPFPHTWTLTLPLLC